METLKKINETITEFQNDNSKFTDGCFGYYSNWQVNCGGDEYSERDDSENLRDQLMEYTDGRPKMSDIKDVVERAKKLGLKDFVVTIWACWYEKLDGEMQPTDVEVYVEVKL